MSSENSSSFYGPFCQAAKISLNMLNRRELPSISSDVYTNGLVLEIDNFGRKYHWTVNTIIDILYTISESDCMRSSIPVETVKKRLATMREKKKRYKKGSKTSVEFMNTIFDLCKGRPHVTNNAVSNVSMIGDLTVAPHAGISHEDRTKLKPAKCLPTTCETTKSHKLLLFKIKKSQKLLASLTTKITKMKRELTLAGHYKKKNVDRRQKRTNEKMKELLHVKQASILKDRENLSLREELEQLKSANIQLLKKNISLNCKVKICRLKTANAQKNKSKLKVQLDRHKDCVVKKNVIDLKKQLREKNAEICNLETKLDSLKQEKENVLDLKEGGSYSVPLRMLVNELTALEVSQSKVSPVIDAVSHHLFDTKILKLPDRKSVQNMNDEGHYIAKRFISILLEESDHWSLHKDGTTRRKQKILETSVVSANAKLPMSLGFCIVASETGETIASTAKEHLTELAEISGKDETQYLAGTLSTLTAYMNDRAANEKKSNRILDSWRDGILRDAGVSVSEKTKVHHCHCMMHVLLSFHKNVTNEAQIIQKTLEENENLGRDSLPCFSTWKQQSIPERIAYTASNIFGPVGDYKGARDIWEGHCSLHGIKSRISNYKDNRFNGLFETCAQVMHHREDFLYVLGARNSNKLLQSLKADLEDQKVMVFVQAMAILFVQITGPYWNMIETYDVPYMNLCTVIQPLLLDIESYINDPTELLYEGPASLRRFKNRNIQQFNGILTPPSQEHIELLESVLKAAAEGLSKTIKKQLTDFLPGGEYSMPADAELLQSTSFLPKHNLVSEHNFGDLDSSQRRRPNCSMHHHSTVHLLKRNRDAMKKWYASLPPDARVELWEKARKCAKDLRKNHKDEEMRQRNLLYSTVMEKGAKKSQQQMRQTDEGEHDLNQHLDHMSAREEELKKVLPGETDLTEGQWVAVAYQDNWYPGIVKASPQRQLFTVDFMKRTSNPSHFKSPNGKDVQTVIPMYLLAVNLEPVSVGRGRSWTFDSIQLGYMNDLFQKFKTINF